MLSVGTMSTEVNRLAEPLVVRLPPGGNPSVTRTICDKEHRKDACPVFVQDEIVDDEGAARRSRDETSGRSPRCRGALLVGDARRWRSHIARSRSRLWKSPSIGESGRRHHCRRSPSRSDSPSANRAETSRLLVRSKPHRRPDARSTAHVKPADPSARSGYRAVRRPSVRRVTKGRRWRERERARTRCPPCLSCATRSACPS